MADTLQQYTLPPPVEDTTDSTRQIVISEIQAYRGLVRIGGGSQVFVASNQGIQLGNGTFTAAPFSVDMNGNVTAISITITTTGTAGETLVAGNSVYVKASDSKLYKSDTGGDESTYSFVGIVSTGGASGATVYYVGPGSVATGLSLSAGSYYYLSTSGALSTAPDATRSAKVGHALTSTTMRVLDPTFIRKGNFTCGATGTTTVVTTGFYPSRIDFRCGATAGGATRTGSSVGDDTNACVTSSSTAGGDSSDLSYAYKSITHADGIALSFGTVSAKSATTFTVSHQVTAGGTTTLQWTAYS